MEKQQPGQLRPRDVRSQRLASSQVQKMNTAMFLSGPVSPRPSVGRHTAAREEAARGLTEDDWPVEA